jgi:thioredoxin 1
MAHEFTDATFENEVLKSEKPVLVDFWAPWCGPCKMMGPIIDKVAKDMADTVVVGKLNTDDNQETAMKYSITGIPTFILFKNGKEIGRAQAFQPEPKLKEFITSRI